MTKPALTLDSLATATIAFYITSDPNSPDLIDALRKFSNDELADMTIDEIAESELIFDIFIDTDTNIDDITNPEYHYMPEFRDMLITAFADARRNNFPQK